MITDEQINTINTNLNFIGSQLYQLVNAKGLSKEPLKEAINEVKASIAREMKYVTEQTDRLGDPSPFTQGYSSGLLAALEIMEAQQ